MRGRRTHLSGTKKGGEGLMVNTEGGIIKAESDVVEVEKGLKVIPGANVLIASVDYIVNWGRRSSLWPLTFGLA